ncbi:hypothetical protein BASA61_008088 [Batrachochytrium salamandrivorans]|nr:hypothetical protein BASA61_008088 [Batrachochytrium salamandrivorans]
MATLEDIVASLTDRLRSLEIENQALNKELAPTVCVNPKPLSRQVRWLPQTLSRIHKPAGTGLSTTRQRYDTDRKKIATLGTLLTDKALSGTTRTSNSRTIRVRLSSWSAFKERMKATFGEINQEQVSETKLRALSIFYFNKSHY